MSLNNKEMNILVTGVANLVNTRSMCKVSCDPYDSEKTKYRILCTDGKNRRISRKQLVELLEKVAGFAGNEISDEAKAFLKGVMNG